MRQLCAVLRSGAAPKLEKLYLNENGVGDGGALGEEMGGGKPSRQLYRVRQDHTGTAAQRLGPGDPGLVRR